MQKIVEEVRSALRRSAIKRQINLFNRLVYKTQCFSNKIEQHCSNYQTVGINLEIIFKWKSNLKFQLIAHAKTSSIPLLHILVTKYIRSVQVVLVAEISLSDPPPACSLEFSPVSGDFLMKIIASSPITSGPWVL